MILALTLPVTGPATSALAADTPIVEQVQGSLGPSGGTAPIGDLPGGSGGFGGSSGIGQADANTGGFGNVLLQPMQIGANEQVIQAPITYVADNSGRTGMSDSARVGSTTTWTGGIDAVNTGNANAIMAIDQGLLNQPPLLVGRFTETPTSYAMRGFPAKFGADYTGTDSSAGTITSGVSNEVVGMMTPAATPLSAFGLTSVVTITTNVVSMVRDFLTGRLGQPTTQLVQQAAISSPSSPRGGHIAVEQQVGGASQTDRIQSVGQVPLGKGVIAIGDLVPWAAPDIGAVSVFKCLLPCVGAFTTIGPSLGPPAVSSVNTVAGA